MGDSGKAIDAADMRAPSGSGATAALPLSGSGTTPVGNTTALVTDALATLLVGAAPVRVGWGATKAAAETAASATAPLLPAYGRFDWRVCSLDDHVAVRDATNGVVAFEAHVWTSSGPRVGE